MLDWLKTIPQYLIPQHLLSRLFGVFANSKTAWFKNALIHCFIKVYQVNMQEALQPNPQAYPDFNHFFIRHLNPDARQCIAGDDNIACPVDGAISQVGHLSSGQLVQAKGRQYSLVELFAGLHVDSEPFVGGHFATIYLAPKDYHRIHMPCAGTLKKMIYVPGKLFSVNPTTVRTVPKLFARNERVICLFDTALGPMAMILVGATIVASIATVWHGTVTPPTGHTIHQWNYPNPNTQAITLAKGDEMGHFKLGSTVIVLFANQRIQWQAQLKADSPVRLGEGLANIASAE